MTMKKFKADLSAAQQKVDNGNIKGLEAIRSGISDGEVILVFNHPKLTEKVRIHALAQDTSEYPDTNAFMLYTEIDSPPEFVTEAVKDAADYMIGLSVYEMAIQVANSLNSRLNPKADVDTDCDAEPNSDEDPEDNPDADDDDDFDLDEYEYDEDAAFGLPSVRPPPSKTFRPTVASAHVLQRIRQDLKQVHNAGYKLGILENFARTAASGVFSISIKVGALALSEGAMEAWDLREDEYIILLIRTESYATLEELITRPVSDTRPKFRIGKCRKHKPSLYQALRAFDAGTLDVNNEGDESDHFQKLFLSNSLDQFMDESLISLVKFREYNGCNWEQANEALQNASIKSTGDAGDSDLKFDAMDVDDEHQQHHQVLLHDHLREKHQERSFPLIAMQFAMQYFIRCTEYCLRCHRKLEKGFEALRPYVCSNPLCLFQYMSMGFGPSIEHEILTEPYVVDLLVSLCYAALHPINLSTLPQIAVPLPIRDLPVGLRLKVPDISGNSLPKFRARLQGNRILWDEYVLGLEAIMAPSKWVAFRALNQQAFHHARIIDFNLGTKSASVNILAMSGNRLSPIPTVPTAPGTPALPGTPSRAPVLVNGEVEVFPYDTDFDDLDKKGQGVAMTHVLDTLPSILEIEQWLKENPLGSLKAMDSVSPAAASLLQWIVSSNRSCIFQVDRSRSVAKGTPGGSALADKNECAGRGTNREHERIIGMPGWIQFRFAQGSPDKELRFNRALQEVAQAKQAKGEAMTHPTIFAWHGSRLSNWHSIVRTGLDYNNVTNGRAFGHGVYFSPHFSTSHSYASGHGGLWPNSKLNFGSCISLNEIINAPEMFVSRSPHYVVAQPDWHQCRYLFISPYISEYGHTHSTTKEDEAPAGVRFLSLARGLEPISQNGQALKIPASAIPARNIGTGLDSIVPTKRTRSQLSSLRDDNEDAEDVAIVFETLELDKDTYHPAKRPATSDNMVSGNSDDAPAVTLSVDQSLTDFVPGALDLSNLPRLEPPSFANDAALKAIGREVKKLQAVQSRTPLHELGWYIDFDQITNLFQWIVELHSFDASLPLALDMKAAKVTSIVAEVRFPKDYPWSPPFLRIIRPRFLPFMNGGGGHVTIGGALCMELLTTTGWSPANSIESVFVQVRMALCSTEPPARLDNVYGRGGVASYQTSDYGIGEAIEAYIRAAGRHGWKVPDDLRKTASGA
ncbi:ubiquitin-conjugating enzyme E2 Q2 [Cladorrhinum sp. PSN259]|nr:ubiquitin-conjugating enzyme E2 Q2 [Cladorrhinum sp. PSN259]